MNKYIRQEAVVEAVQLKDTNAPEGPNCFGTLGESIRFESSINPHDGGTYIVGGEAHKPTDWLVKDGNKTLIYDDESFHHQYKQQSNT